jgi:hypothetical protein
MDTFSSFATEKKPIGTFFFGNSSTNNSSLKETETIKPTYSFDFRRGFIPSEVRTYRHTFVAETEKNEDQSTSDHFMNRTENVREAYLKETNLQLDPKLKVRKFMSFEVPVSISSETSEDADEETHDNEDGINFN